MTELQMHMRSVVSGDKSQVMMDYVPALQRLLTKPLIDQEQACLSFFFSFSFVFVAINTSQKEGIDPVIELMDEYCITREDWDSVMDLCSGGSEPILKQINSNVKSAFTRKYTLPVHVSLSYIPFRYNTESHLAKVGAVMSKVTSSRATAGEYEEEEPAFVETEEPLQEDGMDSFSFFLKCYTR